MTKISTEEHREEAKKGNPEKKPLRLGKSHMPPERQPTTTPIGTISGEAIREAFSRHTHNRSGPFSWREYNGSNTYYYLAEMTVHIPEEITGATISIQFETPAQLSAQDNVKLEVVFKDGKKISMDANDKKGGVFFRFNLPEEFITELKQDQDSYAQGESREFKVLSCNFVLEKKAV